MTIATNTPPTAHRELCACDACEERAFKRHKREAARRAVHDNPKVTDAELFDRYGAWRQAANEASGDAERDRFHRAAERCWALLEARRQARGHEAAHGPGAFGWFAPRIDRLRESR